MWYCCAEGLALQCPSSSDELINYIIIITMFVPFTLFHVDRYLKRLDNHSQYSVEQMGSDCTRIDLRASVLPRARMREGVKKSVLSVCQSVCLSVCPVKNFEIRTFTSLKDCCMRQ